MIGKAVEKVIQDALFSRDNLVDYVSALDTTNSQQTGDSGFQSFLKTFATEAGESDYFEGRYC